MGTATDPYELRFDTGRICLDLIATTHPVERLGSVVVLRAWIAGSGLVPPGTPLAHADATWLTGFRELRRETARLVRARPAPAPAATTSRWPASTTWPWPRPRPRARCTARTAR